MNVSEHSVTGYRIGWVVVYPSGRSKVGLGLAIDVPAGIKPGEVANVPAQAVSLDFVKEGASAVFFFVTDVYSTGVPAWKPELVKVATKSPRNGAPGPRCPVSRITVTAACHFPATILLLR